MVSFSSIVVSLCSLASMAMAQPVPAKGANNVQLLTAKNNKRYYEYDSNTPIRGVNIGGWLVLEPYITPSLFEAFRTNDYNDDGIPVDEYHFCQTLGHTEAQNRLIDHWSTFYTAQDFQDIADMGFNMVRIPVGYWAFKTLENDPYVTGYQEFYLDQAISWAKKAGLKVWVDLHGAAGSQNGFDNSGLRDSINFLEDSNLELTTEVLQYILKKYSQSVFEDTVIGIELINEPLGPAIDLEKLKTQYYEPAYKYLRETLGSNQNIIIHDAFEAYNYWDSFWNEQENGNWGITVDHHHYQVFSPGECQRGIDERISVACAWGTGVLSEQHWTVAGEFSAALTDCAKWLNGVGVGARFDGSYVKGSATSYYIGSCQNNDDIDSWSEERKQNTRRFIEAELDAFEMKGGWIMWCWKTESAPEWDVKLLAGAGVWPQPLTDRQYPGQCSN
ncbi:hypothetical protein TBLA_0E00950 [Henningerozyma blattae CBS 6284]|uniref:glucan 1,3-beta-glucosidase n=1 Tax=Henningerozyma blattae (strain ATCC 34711 / CBS 6284 / DSM 70876 / NBRC 10599 / NRRL Y-10934 / UCD 77-7) TaxID=1071380 RepID=I2H454_HENB6|nr:hypothetical protein TBLA_0E00950 [Tetrapisispora blattae CBS 6284]CCH61156.1 hypothetical protein TBLA_0E00950 [Tetrapisispora blattae CBS 6284]